MTYREGKETQASARREKMRYAVNIVDDHQITRVRRHLSADSAWHVFCHTIKKTRKRVEIVRESDCGHNQAVALVYRERRECPKTAS